MTFAKTILRACAPHPSARVGRTLLGLVVLLLLLCVSAAPSFARSSACAAFACPQQLAISLSGEAAGEEGEEGESEEAGEEGEEKEDEGSSEEEDEEAASAEAEAEEEAELLHKGRKRRGARGSDGAIVLSDLHLTHKSVASLKHSPLASRVEFSFSVVKSMKVRVTLVKQGKPHTRKRWTAVPADSLTISATKGSNRHRLLGHNRLAAGRYRLTLSPVRGRVRSIYVSVRG